MIKKFSLIVIVAIFFSCNKDKNPPTIQFVSPTEGQSFVTEGVMHIVVNVEDDELINKVTYKIYEREKVYTPNSKTFKVDELASMYNIGGGNLDITITAEDNNGNVTTQKVTVKHSY
ncbi:MAG: hypothetical protein HYZ42_08275 [Bacteroidetes bacterium]|nr:hypothetical protein [Bacteroidota bacterium]